MSTLNTARQGLVAILQAVPTWTVYGYVPERINAPAAIVSPDDPYVTSDGPFGTVTVRWTVTLVADVATNEVVTEDLDALVEDALVALANGGVHVTTVDEPYVFQSTENLHLATDLHCTTTVTL